MVVQRMALGHKGEVALRPDGIVEVRWFSGVSIGEADAVDATAAADSLGGGRGTHVLVDMAGISGLSRAGRAVFARRCSARKVALLGASPVDQVIANFFLRLNIPPCPTRYFSSSAEAEGWLATPTASVGTKRRCVRRPRK